MGLLKNTFCLILLILSLFPPGCSLLSPEHRARKEYQRDEAQYQPYRARNSIEGYREFISLYPGNLFVDDAKVKIENLEFAPYEQADTIEGYMEFKARYPENRHTYKAGVKIEQTEVKRYEKMDTVGGYREFLAKYPESPFAVLAHKRLQELEFREHADSLASRYGFDLLGYRLFLKRLKKQLRTVNGMSVADFTCFASLATLEGKNYFHTSLIYPTKLSHLDTASTEVRERFFNPLIAPALVYLEEKFPPTGTIDGFSFDVASSAHSFHGDRIPLLEYYFTRHQAALFSRGKIDGKGLLAEATILAPEKKVETAKPAVGVEEPKAREEIPWKDLNGMKVMGMVAARKRADDYIISRSFQRGKHTTKSIEKRKVLNGRDGFMNKSVVRYLDPPDYYGINILTWNYTDRKPAFWAAEPHGSLANAPRLTNTERVRPPAEADFCLTDFVEINLRDEKHLLLRSETLGDKACFVVESTPIGGDKKYGRRTSWIDQGRLLPLKVAYWDRAGRPWKVLTIEWRNTFGYWFWKRAVAENVKTAEKTVITTEDVRVNLGLDDRDFTRQGLERQKHGFNR